MIPEGSAAGELEPEEAAAAAATAAATLLATTADALQRTPSMSAGGAAGAAQHPQQQHAGAPGRIRLPGAKGHGYPRRRASTGSALKSPLMSPMTMVSQAASAALARAVSSGSLGSILLAGGGGSGSGSGGGGGAGVVAMQRSGSVSSLYSSASASVSATGGRGPGGLGELSPGALHGGDWSGEGLAGDSSAVEWRGTSGRQEPRVVQPRGHQHGVRRVAGCWTRGR